jgi:hypothetical protein
MNLSSEHIAALNWFQQRAGQTLTWQELQTGPCILTISAKGIYKPKSSAYVLSIRQGLDSPYSDEEPVYQSDGSWTFRYAQEEQSGKDAEELFTNQGMQTCMQDAIPLAVLRQVSKKPDTRYHLLGLAKVIEWRGGFFTLNSTTINLAVPVALVNDGLGISVQQPFTPYIPASVQDGRIRVLREITARQGQASFRSGLLTAYEGRCAISGCEVSEVLEAAHITPYRGPETNCVTNGLLLRSDLHTLWDQGLIFLDGEMRLHIKDSLKQSEYAALDMKEIFLPGPNNLRPSLAAVKAHRDWCLDFKYE